MSLIDSANRYASKVKWTSIAVMVVSLLVIARSLPLAELARDLRTWIESMGVAGYGAFVAIYVVATVLFLPGSILTLAAGAVFGLLPGFIAVSIGSTLGAGAAFLVARYVARRKVAEVAAENRRFDAIDRAIGEGGWRIVGLLRLSPAVPFNLQNYLFGLTPVGFWAYLLTSWVAMMPGTFLYVYIGHVTGAAVGGARERTTAEWVALGVGLLATLVVTIYVTKLAREKLQERTEIEEGAEAEEDAADVEGEEDVEPVVLGWPWSATVALLLALFLATTAAFAQLGPGGVTGWLQGLFGPPKAELEEAYEPNPEGPSFDHSTLDELLASHVDDGGWVDYQGLRRDGEGLDRYIASVAEAPFDAMGRDEKLALLINGYNAFTLKLILDHWPVESIKDIPADERWEAERWRIGRHTWSLNQIEHEEIRPKFREPRIHFALVCAAVGCPPLRTESFRAEELDAQLEDQAEYVFSHERWLRYDEEDDVLHLTELLDWYGGDFEQVAGSVLEYVARYSDSVAEDLAADRRPAIEWIPYDWSLNSLANRPSE